MGVRGGLERADYWREVIREQEASGLSIAAFCRQRGVGQASFYNWRAKLRQQDDPANRQAAKFVPIELSAMPSGQPAMDHPATTPATAACDDFEVLLGNGRSVRVPASFDPQTLRELLDVLEKLPC
jgi:transposase-like protein